MADIGGMLMVGFFVDEERENGGEEMNKGLQPLLFFKGGEIEDLDLELLVLKKEHV